MPRVAVLSGGVGGARFLRGLVAVVDPGNVYVIANVADDAEILGLHVSPDLDSILYTLAGLADEERGWGRADETWNALDTVARAGGETWFLLGDRDIGLHLVRTQALRAGDPLSVVTARLAVRFGLRCALLPSTDDRLRTAIVTSPGERLAFQEWFVGRRHADEVAAVHYDGAESARALPAALEALETADLVVIAPSNPFLSIHPILAVPELRAALERRRVPCVAVSPLVGGAAVKGPAAAMFASLAGGTTAAHVARAYVGVADALVVDEADAPDAHAVAATGIQPIVAPTLMRDAEAAAALARVTLEAAVAC
jgi:LPPG:FO 2-phospho-L-lactate transferase